MTKFLENPWLNMRENTVRRVDLTTIYNFFWICDQHGNFGMLIHFSEEIKVNMFHEQMKGVSIIPLQDIGTKLYIVLHERKDWELFFAVCNDIISNASKSKDEKDMVVNVIQRLKRWRKFLSEDNLLTLTEKIQMGLFAELKCIKDFIIPFVGYKKAIIAWVGPGADQKDFSLDDYFIEVKSFISSKGQSVIISSLDQLDDEVKPIYLVTYALTLTSTGLDITMLISAIESLIPSTDIQIKSLFEEKLAAYGYFSDITKPPFSNYFVDSCDSYLVDASFPRISSNMIDNRISKVKYSLDLSRCSIYKKSLPFGIN